jgi:hypothetical protein
VAVRIVADDAFAQPQYLIHAEIIAEIFFNFDLAQLRIPIGIEQTGAGGQERGRGATTEISPRPVPYIVLLGSIPMCPEPDDAKEQQTNGNKNVRQPINAAMLSI